MTFTYTYRMKNRKKIAIHFLNDSSLEEASTQTKVIQGLRTTKKEKAHNSSVIVARLCPLMLESPQSPIDIPSDLVVEELELGPIDLDKDAIGLPQSFIVPNVPRLGPIWLATILPYHSLGWLLSWHITSQFQSAKLLAYLVKWQFDLYPTRSFGQTAYGSYGLIFCLGLILNA